MAFLCFNVFGRIFAVRRDGEWWQVYAVGSDGKLGHAGFEIPNFIADHELEQYLADISVLAQLKRGRCLTLASSGRLQAGFARRQTPLMLSVRHTA